MFVSVYFIIRTNTNYKSISQIKCEKTDKIWDEVTQICTEKFKIDDVDKIEDKQIWEASKSYDISVFYTTFWITTLDQKIKNDLDKMVSDFKEIRKNETTPGQLIITNKYFKYKDDIHNFLSIVFEKKKIISSKNEEIEYITYVFDINTWNFLTINDILLKSWDPLWILYESVKWRLLNKAENIDVSLIEKWAWKIDFNNYKNFYFDGKKLVLIFLPWKVFQVNEWAQFVEIPFYEIRNILVDTIR